MNPIKSEFPIVAGFGAFCFSIYAGYLYLGRQNEDYVYLTNRPRHIFIQEKTVEKLGRDALRLVRH